MHYGRPFPVQSLPEDEWVEIKHIELQRIGLAVERLVGRGRQRVVCIPMDDLRTRFHICFQCFELLSVSIRSLELVLRRVGRFEERVVEGKGPIEGITR